MARLHRRITPMTKRSLFKALNLDPSWATPEPSPPFRAFKIIIYVNSNIIISQLQFVVQRLLVVTIRFLVLFSYPDSAAFSRFSVLAGHDMGGGGGDIGIRIRERGRRVEI